jgi:hypothetical protein
MTFAAGTLGATAGVADGALQQGTTQDLSGPRNATQRASGTAHGLISQTFQRLHVRRLATVSLLIHRQSIAQAHTQNCPRRGDLSKLDLTTPSPYAVLPKPLCGARRNRPAQFLAVLPGSRMTYSITRN